MLKIGVTGGIGVGKSTVTRIFSILGVPVYDADKRAKWLLNNNVELIDQIKSQFGEISYSNNLYNTRFISSIVFNDKIKLDKLNSIIHPKIFEDSNLWFLKHSTNNYVINEAALMVESGSYQNVDKLIVVTSPMNLRLKRISQRDSFRDQNEIELIISKQLSESSKIEKSDYVIHNDESNLLITQVLKLDAIFNSFL